MTGTENDVTVARPEPDPKEPVDQAGLRGYWTALRRRVSGGELGSLPVIIGLVVIWAYLYSQNSRFLSAENLTNLGLQMAATGTISVGIVLVLLLGEIDLSVGAVSGVCGGALVVLNVNRGMNAGVAIVLALLIGALIGTFQGLVFTRFGVPSFVVTLAGLIGWQGVQLQILGKAGTINLPFTGGVAKLTTTFFSPAVSWVLVVVAIAVYALVQLREFRTRRNNGLRPRPVTEIVVRTAVVAASLIVTIVVLNRFKGVPLPLVIFLGFVIVFDLLIKRSRYGRHILAVGGNAEAARRAGISVDGIRLSVFILASTMAAAGGILAASRAFSVSLNSGSGDVLLNAIAAAVIGGTSLFGGRGAVLHGVLGGIVIASIDNGMGLLGFTAAAKDMVTALVLLAAVTIDALARRGRLIGT